MGTIGRTNTGGAGLNLTILASVEQPPSPVDNMVWINTDTAIPNWYWQDSEPSAAEKKEGVLWIATSTAATNKLDLLRNNNLVVGFGTAKQYTDGKWDIVGGKIYYSGTWHNLQTFVYDGTIGNAENNFNHNIGGYPWRTSSGNVSTTISTAKSSFTCNFSGGGYGLCYTRNKIDFTDVSKVKITYTESDAGFINWRRAMVFNSVSSGNPSGVMAYASFTSQTSKKSITINTSSVSGTYYLGFGYYSNTTAAVSIQCNIFSIELVS